MSKAISVISKNFRCNVVIRMVMLPCLFKRVTVFAVWCGCGFMGGKVTTSNRFRECDVVSQAGIDKNDMQVDVLIQN